MKRLELDRLYRRAMISCRCSFNPPHRSCADERRQAALDDIVERGIEPHLALPRVGAAIRAGMDAWRHGDATHRNPYKNRGWSSDLHWWWQVGWAWAEWTESGEAVLRALSGDKTDLWDRWHSFIASREAGGDRARDVAAHRAKALAKTEPSS